MGEKRTASTHLTRMMDVSCPIEKAATIFIPRFIPKFIPRNAWHGFTTPDNELLLLWITTLAGLDGFFASSETLLRPRAVRHFALRGPAAVTSVTEGARLAA